MDYLENVGIISVVPRVAISDWLIYYYYNYYISFE
jgi:hypothetical protein